MNRKKRRPKIKAEAAELNIMPFIDIFSMLNTFLLVSAAFVNIGMIEVQIPFLTNAPPPKDKPARSLSIHIAVETDKVELQTKWSEPPLEEKTEIYKLDKADLLRLHKDLVVLRKDFPEFDTVNVYSDDEVKYKSLVTVLDEIMVHKQGDPVFDEKHDVANPSVVPGQSGKYIYRKVVMAGVIL